MSWQPRPAQDGVWGQLPGVRDTYLLRENNGLFAREGEEPGFILREGEDLLPEWAPRSPVTGTWTPREGVA